MLKTDDRILILAPHPDDEVLGCGGVILQAIKKGLPLKVVFFTYGDSNEWSFLKYRKRLIVTPKQIRGMGLVRYKEAVEAAKILGVHWETVKRMCREGRIPARKVHNMWLIDKDVLAKFASTYDEPRRGKRRR